MPARALEHPADDVVGLHGIAGFHVAHHRGAPVAVRVHEARLCELDGLGARRVALARGDLDVGVDRALHRLAPAGRGHDLAHVGAEEARGRGERGKEHDLLPHVLLDVGRERPTPLRLRERVGQRLRARAHLPVALAEDDARERIHVRDGPVLAQGHVDLRDTAHHL